MTVTRCGLVDEYGPSDEQSAQILYDSLRRVIQPEVGGPGRSI